MKNFIKFPYIEIDEHIGVSNIYFPQLMMELDKNTQTNSDLALISFDLINVFALKYFDAKHPINTLITEIEFKKLDLNSNRNLLKRIFKHFEKNCKHYYNDFNPYEDKTIFKKLKV
jgi:hypothetical protein